MYVPDQGKIIQQRIRERMNKEMNKPEYSEDFLKKYEKTPIKDIKCVIKNTMSHLGEKIEIDLDELNSTELMKLYYLACEKKKADASYSLLLTQINGRVTIEHK